MRLSIVVPCYNCKNTIGRLLDSILANGLDKYDYEVIIVDDKSTDGFLDVVKLYQDKMQIIYTETTRDVHCPGNTRQCGLTLIRGEWFCFADNDDMFEPFAFKSVFKYLDENPNTYTLCTCFRSYDPYADKFVGNFIDEDTDTWLHGKFYNTEKTLNEFKCHFADDMLTHEDVYFNSWNLAHLIDCDREYVYLRLFTYRWVFNPDSITRKHFLAKNKYSYIETYMDDYLHSTSDPRFEMMKKSQNPKTQLWCLDQIMMTLLHAYFYYQASIYRLGGATDTLDSEYIALKHFKKRITDETGLEENGMISYAYQNAQRFDDVRKHGISGTMPFIETQSFRDFILNL